ncbi:MAG: hypothetical protein GY906_26890 [bacterium]|nr:hypothetical protein [bacterium]
MVENPSRGSPIAWLARLRDRCWRRLIRDNGLGNPLLKKMRSGLRFKGAVLTIGAIAWICLFAPTAAFCWAPIVLAVGGILMIYFGLWDGEI